MESKTREMREFVRGLFRGSPDLSLLTQRSIREQFLKHTDKNSLGKEDQKTLKMIVEKELLRMKVDDPRDESLKSEVVAGKVKKRARSSSCSSSEGGAIKGANSTPPRKPPMKKKQMTSNTGDSSDTEDFNDKEHPKKLPFIKKSSQENLVDGSAMGLSLGKEVNVQNGTASQKAVVGNESKLKGFTKKGESDSEGELKRESDCLKMGRKVKMISEEDGEQKNRSQRGSPLKVKKNKSSSEEEVEEEEAKHLVARLPKGKPGKISSEEAEPKKRARLSGGSLNTSQTDSETEEDEKASKIRRMSKKRRLSKSMPAVSSTEEEPTVIEHPRKGRMVKERAVACNAEDDENKKANKQSSQKRPLKARNAYHSDESNEEDQPKKTARLKGGPLKAKAAASSDDEEELVKQTSQRGRPSRARETSHYYESSEEEEPKRKIRHSKCRTNSSSEEEAEEKPHKKVSLKAMPLDAKKETDSGDEDWDQLEKKGKPLKSKPSSSSDEERESDKKSVFSKHKLLKAAKTSSSEEDVKPLAYGTSKQNKAKQAKKSSEDDEEPKTKNVSQADGDKEVLKGKGSEMMQRKKMDHASNSDSLDNEEDSSIDDEASPERSGNAHQADQTTKGIAPAKKHSGSSSDDSAEEEPSKEKALLPNKMKTGLSQKTKATSRVDKESGSSSNSEADSRAMNSSTKNQSQEKKGERKDGSDTSSDEEDQVEVEKKDDERTKKHKGKKSSTTAEKEQAGGDEHPSIKRMKRYITACGVRKNYKKLFEGHRSVKSKVIVLKKELEDLGVKGNPTLEKCKVVKLMREEQEELASLDMSNIISKSGRPRRRNAWDPNRTPTTTPPKEHQRCIDSDSEEDAPPRKKRIMDWGNLKGIISDEDESSG
ncbi:HIRA-interacting protein 3 [Ambystoma mexicanum]|uniref:HIRA-interacting protein 3 n=1 Tax=Ambystoma mexicanum TaxID=8296 RepID=UPI0037E8147C